MHFSKKFLVFIALLFLSCCVVSAQDWAYAPNGNTDVYVDKDSVTKNEKGIFYVVKYWDDGLQKKLYAIMQTPNNNKAGVVKSYTEDSYNKIKDIKSIMKNSSAKNIKTLTLNSPLYNANVLARQISRYDLKNVPQNPNIYKSYMDEIQTKIKAHWEPPKYDTSIKTVAMFSVSKDGNLISVSILQSSGDLAVDNAAIKAIKDSAPFRSFPEGANDESVDIEFTFDYNVWVGKNKI